VTKLKHYAYLMRLDKPIGIFLLLWPTLWALLLANQGNLSFKIVIIFVLGVILMRSAGCIINDIADRHFDKHVLRTQNRPLVLGHIKVMEAFYLFLFCISTAFLLVLFLNRLTIELSFLAILFAMIYPFLKRVTHLPQAGLGIAFAWGVPMAFAAENNTIPIVAWEIFLAAFIWPIIYDTMYAMVDRQDDIKIGVKSSAILFGRSDRLVIGFLQILFVVLLMHIGFLFQLPTIYFFGLFLTSMLFFYQQWLIKNRDPGNCFKAFLNNHWIGMIIFAGIFLS